MKEYAIVVADNVIIYENEMRIYLEYVRNSGRYKSCYFTDDNNHTKKIG